MVSFSSKGVALVSVFAALHVILYLTSFGLWRNWAIYLEPLEGIILGPWIGFFAAFIGSIVARTIKPTDVWMFGIVAEPMGVLACGLLVKGHWKPLLTIYAILLTAYFIHPLGRRLPLWAILDIFFAFILVYPVTKMCKSLFEKDIKHLSVSIPLISFVGTVTDSLMRVFLLVPVQLYMLFGWPTEVVYSIFTLGAIDSYIEDMLVIIVSASVGVPLLAALRKIPGFKFPLS